MKLVYTPEGGSRREWDLDFDNVPWDVTFGTEKATGWPWGEFKQKFARESSIALQALLFVLRKRDEPRLQLDAVTPRWGEVDLVLTDEEQAIVDGVLPPENAEEPDPEA